MPISFYVMSLTDAHPPTIKNKCIPLSEISLMHEQMKHKRVEHGMQSIEYIIERKLNFKIQKKHFYISECLKLIEDIV